MEELTCPRCQESMASHAISHATAWRCEGCGGVFLERIDLGALIEAENDWHHYQSANTAALPRITPGMSAPPESPARSRAFVETLFRR